MLCGPAKSPDGSSRPQTQAQNRMGGVHQASLDSTPEACKCITRHSQHTEGGDITGSGCWLSADVLIKLRTGPGCLVYGLKIEQSICLAEDLHPYCIWQGVGECEYGCGAMALDWTFSADCS